MKRILLVVVVLLIAINSGADQFTHEAKVVSVSPVLVSRTTDRLPAHCHSSKPLDFDALLKWDLACENPETVEVTAYRVTYEIGGRHFTTVLDESPDETLAVRIRLDS